MRKNRNSKKSISEMTRKERRLERAVLTLLSTGFLLAEPLGASQITPDTTHGADYTTSVTQNGGVYTVTPGKNMIHNGTGFNRFEKFTLDKGHIANMKFENESASASKLYNFVKDEINVNGTVNALKNGTIGGHMIFVSPKGMVIGSSGVINAGRFTGAVAEQDYFDDFISQREPWDGDKFKSLESNLIPLNREGTITVKGGARINAPGGIRLAASRIDIAQGARLDTVTTDFAGLVNAVKEDGTIQDWGVTGANLAITHDGSGDVYLVAQGTTPGSFISSVGHTVSKDTAVASVDVAGTIEASGDVVIAAKASNGAYDTAESLTAGKDVFSGGIPYADVTSRVNVASTGSVIAGGDVKVDAQSLTVVGTTTVEDVASFGFTILGMTTPINIEGAVTTISSSSSVTVDGTLTAAKALDISANSSVTTDRGADISVTKIVEYTGNIPAFAASVALVDSHASVTVGKTAKLTAQSGPLSIASQSNLTGKISSVGSVYQTTGETQVMSALTVSDMESTSKVDVLEGAQITTSGDLTISSVQTGSVTASAAAGASPKANGSVSLAVNLLDTDAQVNISADIGTDVKPAKMTITAQNTVKSWNSVAGGTAGAMNQGFTMAKGKAKGDIITAVFERLKNITGDWSSNAFQMDGGTVPKAFEAGGALSVVLGAQKSSVNVAEGRSLLASGDISVTSSTVLADRVWKALAQAGAGKSGADQTSLALGFLWAQPEIKSAVNVERGAKVVSSNGTVALMSSAQMLYMRPQALVSTIQNNFDALKKIFTAEGMADRFAPVEQKWNEMKDDFGTLDQGLGFSDGLVKWSEGMLELGQMLYEAVTDTGGIVTDTFKAISSMADSALAFLDPTNYANMAVRARAASGTAETGKIGFAAAVGVDVISIESGVHIKPDALVQGAKAVALTSLMKNENVAFGGNIDSIMGGIPYPVVTEGKGIGGSFIIQNSTAVNAIDVQQGAQLAAQGAVVISADEKSMYTGAGLSAGVAGDLGFEGNVSVIASDVKNRVRIDDQVQLAAKNVSIAALNDDCVLNVTGAIGISNKTSIGAAAAINALSYTTWARIADFDADFAESSSTNTSVGGIRADSFSLVADGTSDVNAIAVAGAVASTRSQGDEKHWYTPITSIPGKINKGIVVLGGIIADKIKPAAQPSEEAGEMIEMVELGAENVGDEAGEGGANVGEEVVNGDEGHDLEQQNPDAGNQNVGSGLKLTIAGSVGWNDIDYDYYAGAENVAFTPFSGTEPRTTVVSSNLDKWNGAFTGAVALSISKGAEAGTSVSVAGSLSVNDVTSKVRSDVISADFSAESASGTNHTLKIYSATGGSTVASALALALSKTNGTGVGADAAVSINLLDNSVSSTLDSAKRDTDKGVLNVEIVSQARDTQVTGGVSAGFSFGSGSNYGAAASIQAAQIKNSVASKITNSAMNRLGGVEVDALDKFTQVTAGLSVAASPSSGSGNSFAFGGVFSLGLIDNALTSSIENSDLKAGGTILLQAKDTSDKKSPSDTPQTENKVIKKNTDFVSGDIDLTGETYANGSAETPDMYKGVGSGSTVTVPSLLKDGHGLIVTAAAAGSGSGNAAGTGAAVSLVTNRHETRVVSSDLTAEGLQMSSANGVQLIGAAAGAAVGTRGYSVTGSVVWSQTDNTAKNTISGNSALSKLNVKALSMDAANDALTVGVAGQAGLADKTAVGAAMTYGKIENNAMNVVQSADIQSGSAALSASSKGKAWTVAAGATAGNNAVTGSIALTRIKGAAGAEISGSKLSGLSSMTVTGSDTSSARTLAGNIAAGFSNAAVGGAVSYAQIGQTYGNVPASLNLRLKDSSITMKDGGTLSVTGTDESSIFTLSAGISAGTATFAFQGSAAANMLRRENVLKAENVTISAPGGTVEMKLDGAASIDSIAATLTATGGSAAAGVGVSVNRLDANTVLEVRGSHVAANNALFRSASAMSIFNVGAGGAASGKAAVAGSVAVNMLSGSTAARFIDSTAEVAGSMGLVAQSDSSISSYLGSVTGAGTAAIGVLTGVNVMSDSTEASVTSSDVTVSGGAGAAEIETASGMNDSSIFKYNLADGFVPDTLHKERLKTKHTGLVVDSSATHSVVSNLLAGGFAGTGSVLTSVNVTSLHGSTKAAIENSSVSKNSAGGNVRLRAADYSNTGGSLMTVSGSGTLDVSPLVDVTTVTRTTESTLSGAAGNRSTVHADALSVTADSKRGAVSLVAGVGGSGGVAIGGSVAVSNLSGSTLAQIQNVNAQVSSAEVLGSSFKRVGFVTGSAKGSQYLGMGVAVGVLNQTDQTGALIINSDIDMTSDKSGSVAVSADARLEGYTAAASIGAGIYAGAAASVAVNDMENSVTAAVRNANIGSSARRASDISIGSRNASDMLIITGGASVGVGAVGAAVSVNQFYNSTQTEVSDSHLYTAGKASITADEVRSADQSVGSATESIGGAAANVLVTTFGKAADAYSDSDHQSDISSAMGEVTQAINDVANPYVSGAEGSAAPALGSLNILSASEQASANQGRTGQTVKHESGDTTEVSVVIENSTIVSGGDLTAQAKESGKIQTHSLLTAISGVNAYATVAINNLDRKANVSVSGSTLTSGGALTLNSDLTGTASLNSWQGSVTGIGLTAVYTGLNVDADSGVSVTDTSKLAASNDVKISAKDSSSNALDSWGIQGAVDAAGAIVSRLDMKGGVSAETDGSTITAGKKVSVSSVRTGNHTVTGHAGTVAGIPGIGVDMKVSDATNVKTAVGGGTGTALKGSAIDLLAQENSSLEAKTVNVNVGVAAVGVSLADVKSTGNVSVSGTEKNTYSAPSVSVRSVIGSADSTSVEGGREMTAIAHGYGGSLTAGFVYNEANINNSSTSTVSIMGGTFAENADVSVNAVNRQDVIAQADAFNVNLVADLGNNKAEVKTSGGASATVSGDSSPQLSSLSVSAQTIIASDTSSNGDGGGIIVANVGGEAAKTITNITSNTTATLGGSWNTKKDLSVSASQGFANKVKADAVKASVVGASATSLHNTVSGTAKAVIANNSKLNAGGSLTVASASTIKDGNDGDFVLSGSGYGGIMGAFGTTKSDLTLKAASEIGDNASLTSAGDLTLTSFAEGTVVEKTRVLSAGIIDGSGATAKLNVTYDNAVSVGKNASLTTTNAASKLVLAANDSSTVDGESLGDLQGAVAGGATSDMTLTVNRNNAVSVGQGSALLSAGDAALYAGRSSSGSVSSLNYTAVSHAYAHGAITGASAKLKSAINQKNAVTVDGSVKAIGDVALSASKGFIQTIESAERYAWYSQKQEADIVTTALGESISALNPNNSITVNGTVEAGQNNKYQLTIGGTVVLGEMTANGIKVGSMVISSDTALQTAPTLSDSDADVRTVILDYSTNLFERWQEVCELIEEYHVSDNGTMSSAYQGYLAEKAQLEFEMERLGVAQRNANGDIVAVRNLTVQAIEIAPIAVSGGNVTIDTDKMTGQASASIQAHGAPEITVTNNSNLYLILDGMNIEKEGGKIIYNNVAVADGDALRALTTNGVATAKDYKGTAVADAAAGTSAITVENTWDGHDVKIFNANNPSETANLFVLPDISVQGSIVNKVGDVTLHTQKGSIVTGSSTVYAAGSLTLEAMNGTISQYSDGMINIGAAPEDAYKDSVASADAALDGRDKTATEKYVWSGDLAPAASDSKYVAGGSILLAADTINVNGLIQSGFGSYTLDLASNASLESKIKSLDEAWIEAGKPPLRDADLGSSYELTKGTMVKNAAGYYDYVPGCKYNPSTQSVVVENITSSGGSVYLTGRIINTGTGNSGRIVVFDGLADVSLKSSLDTANAHSVKFQTGTISLSDRAGTVSITDTAQSAKPELFDASGTYNPKADLRYNWTGGTASTTTTKVTQSQGFTVWGLFDWGSEKVNTEKSTETVEDATLATGSYVTPLSSMGVSGGSDKDFIVIYDNVITSATTSTDWVESTKYDNWTHFTGTAYRTQVGTTGSKSSKVYSVKADNPISIEVKESANPDAISVEATGAAVLGGSIKNVTDSGSVTITADSIEALSGSSITSSRVSLTGTHGVGASSPINVYSLGDAINPGAVDVTLQSSAGSAAVRVVRGAVNLNASALTAIDVEAQGDISGSAAASRIDLASELGGIGSSSNFFKVTAGQYENVNGTDSLAASFNASAAKDIYAEQTAGSLRVGSVVSAGGDVTLKSSGSIVNANIYGGESELTESARLNLWHELGLFEDRKTNDIEQLSNSIRLEYDYYTTLKETQQTSSEEFKKLDEKYASVTDINAYIAAQKTTEGTALHTLTNSTAYGWTENALKYAIQDAIVNPKQVDVLDETLAVSGKNVTLIAGDSVGHIGDSSVIDLSQGTEAERLESLKQLSLANPYDVTVNSDDTFTVTLHRAVATAADLLTANAGSAPAAKGDILISSPTRQLTIGSVISDADGEIRLMANDDVQLADASSVVSGGSLIVSSGSGSVGSAALPFAVNLTGMMSGSAKNDIYLVDQEGDTHLGAVSGGKNAVITSAANILMSAEANPSAYVGAPTIRLTASGDIGAADNPVRVLTTSASPDVGLFAQAGGGVSVQGMAPTADSMLYVNTVTNSASDDVNLFSAGGIRVSSEIMTQDGSMNVLASHDILLEADLRSGSDMNVSSSEGTLTVDDSAFLTSDGNMILSGGSVELNGDASSDGTLSIAAVSGDVNISGDITSDADMEVSASGDVRLAGDLISGGSADIHADGTAAVLSGSMAEVDRDLTISGAQGVSVSGDLFAGDALTLSSSGGMVVSDSDLDGENITVSGAAGVELAGRADANKTLIAESSAGVVDISGDISADGNILVSGDAGVELGGTVTAEGALDIDSAHGAVAASGDISSGADITVYGAAGAALGGNVTASGDIDMNAVSGMLTTAGNIASSGDISVSGDSGVELGGTVRSGGVLDIDSASGAVVVSGDYIASAGAMTVDGAQGVTVNGIVAGTSTISLASSGGQVVTQGSVLASEDITVSAAGGSIIGGRVGTFRSLSMTGGSAEVKGTLTVSEDATIDVSGDVSLGGDIDVAGGLNVRSGGTTAVAGNVAVSEDIVLSGDAGVSVLGTMAADGNLNVNSSNGTVVTSGDVDAEKDISIYGASGVSLGGDVTASGSMDVRAVSGSLEVSGDIDSAGDMIVSGDSGVAIGGAVFAGGTLDIDSANGAVAVSGDYIASAGAMTVDGAQGVTVGGVVAGMSTASLTSSHGRVETSGSVIVSDDITVSGATGAVIDGNVGTFGSFDMTSGGDAEVNGRLAVSEDASISASGDVSLGGDIDVAGGLNVRSGGTTAVAGNVAVSEDIVLSGDAGVSVLGTMAADGNLNVNSSNGTVVTSGDVDAGKDIAVYGASGVTLGGNVTALGSMDVRAVSGILEVSGDIASAGDMIVSGDSGVVLGGSVATDGELDINSESGTVAASSDISAEKNITIAGAEGVALNGSAAAGIELNVSSENGPVAVSGRMSAGDDITVTASGDVSLDGTFTTSEDLEIESKNGSVAAAGSMSAGDDVVISGAQGVSVDAEITVSDDLEIDSSDGAVSVAGDVSVPGLVAVSGAEGVSIDGNVVSLNLMTLESARGAVSVSGHAASSGDLTISGTQGVSIGGSAVTSRTMRLTSSAGTVSVDGKLVSAGENMYVDGSRGVTLAGVIRANQDLVISSDLGVAQAEGVISADRLLMTGAGVSFGNGAVVSAAQSAALDSGSSIDLRGILTTPSLDITAVGDVTQTLGYISSPHVSATGNNILLLSDKNVLDQVYVDALGGTAEVHSGTSLDIQWSDNVRDLTAIAAGNLVLHKTDFNMNSLWAQSGGSLNAGSVTTAEGAALLAGGDLTAGNVTTGGDLRLHSGGDLTAGALNSGADAWVFGLGYDWQRLSFSSLTARGDAAVVLRQGYTSGGTVAAGGKLAVGVTYFSGPREAPKADWRKVWSYYPYGGMIMPRDPFNVDFNEFLRNVDVDHVVAMERRKRGDRWDNPALTHNEREHQNIKGSVVETIIEISRKLRRSLESFWLTAEKTDSAVSKTENSAHSS